MTTTGIATADANGTNGADKKETAEDFAQEQAKRDRILKSGSWDRDALVHHDDPNAPAKPESPPASPTRRLLHNAHRLSLRNLGRGSRRDLECPMDWGRPGELTEDEVNAFEEFQKEVEKRGGEFRETVYCFGEEEGEAYCLCRWLRARKFVLADTIKMVEEATEERKEPRKYNFYPDGRDALGCDPSLFLGQYPQLYPGFAKNGCPLFISKPGLINIDAIECFTTLDGILKFHWHVMCHDFAGRLKAAKAADSNFTRFECVTVLDLAHLSTGQLNSRTMHVIKVQSFVDSLCFPETMNKMIIVNAPSFFSLTWSIIKGWLDARTASKIEVISSKATWQKRLLELVDADQLPVDYGGTGEATKDALMKEAALYSGGMKRRLTELMHLRGHSSYLAELEADEVAEVVVYTRSLGGAKFGVTDDKKKTLCETKEVIHKGTGDENETPTNEVIMKELKGPGKFKIRADSNTSRFSSDTFVIVCNIHAA